MEETKKELTQEERHFIQRNVEDLGDEIGYLIRMAEFIGTSELIDEAAGDCVWGIAHNLKSIMDKYHDPLMKLLFSGNIESENNVEATKARV